MKNRKIKLAGAISLLLLISNISFTRAETTNETEPKLERHFIFDTIPMNLEEIIQGADRIFTGKCIDVKEIEDDPESKLPVYEYSFNVTEPLRGTKKDEIITFKQWKPTVRDAGYEIGSNYILFLHPNSDRGLTSPVGFLQGQFEVDSKGFFRRNKVVKNKTGNKGLYRNPRNKKTISLRQSQFLNDYVSRCSELGIPIRYKEFIEAVKELAGK